MAQRQGEPCGGPGGHLHVTLQGGLSAQEASETRAPLAFRLLLQVSEEAQSWQEWPVHGDGALPAGDLTCHLQGDTSAGGKRNQHLPLTRALGGLVMAWCVRGM